MSVEFYTVAKARRILRARKKKHTSDTVLAAHSLMEVCERDPGVTFADMLRCLDYGGTIATVGARCLYVRTGRDGLGWQPGNPKGKPYVTNRADWERYLREHFPKYTA